MLNPNFKYINLLKNLSPALKTGKYLVLGSAATLSYTSKINYVRVMNDLDLIADSKLVKKLQKRLITDGFKLATFINKRMPFYNKLMKQSGSRYLRFSKNNINIEILSTNFIETENNNTKFELYPNVWVKIPSTSIVESRLGNVKFVTLNPCLIWGIKQFLNNSLGKIVPYKKVQRDLDLSALKKVVDVSESKSILSKCQFGFWKISINIPTFILN